MMFRSGLQVIWPPDALETPIVGIGIVIESVPPAAAPAYILAHPVQVPELHSQDPPHIGLLLVELLTRVESGYK